MTPAKPKPRGQYLRDPCRPRSPDERIGGGWWVFRRGDGTNRIRPSQWPFEHPTREAAEAQARKLSEAHPGQVFVVVGQVAAHMVEGESA